MKKALIVLILLVVLVGAGAAGVFRFYPELLDNYPEVSRYYRDTLARLRSAFGIPGETAMEHAQKHLKPRYVCPMHPQIVRDDPGNCPICGMDLVLTELARAETVAPPKERKVLYWVAPMDPDYRSDKPGKSPMGMDLVPVYEDAAEDESVQGPPVVSIAPEVVNALGVRTAKAERGPMGRRIDTVGFVDYDENRMSHVHTRTEGWIERLTVKSEGTHVRKGELLFELYSTALVNAQEEYVQALKGFSRRLTRASRERLVALGVSKDQIRALTETQRVQQLVRFYAAQEGVVSALNVREGMFVTPKTEVMTLADLSSVWLLAEVFERQVDWVRVGQRAEVRLSYLPGRVLTGTVEYVYPDLDPTTRTLKARLRFPNPEGILKPNMYADVTIHGNSEGDVVNVPREALIRTGKSQRLILALGEGRFQPREVVAGIESGERVEIRSGLDEGETVVISAQFLIDSEASFKASLMRLQAAGPVSPQGSDTDSAHAVH